MSPAISTRRGEIAYGNRVTFTNERMKPVIEKGIAIPPEQRGGRPRGPFWEMEVGDSVWLPKTAAQSNTFLFAKRHGKKFTTRSETKDGVKGCRVWRIA